MEPSHSGFRYAAVDTTNVLSSYFMTIDMCKFALMRLVYSRNKFFRVGPNISEKFVPGGRRGGTNLRGSKLNVTIPHRVRCDDGLTSGRYITCFILPSSVCSAPPPGWSHSSMLTAVIILSDNMYETQTHTRRGLWLLVDH